MRTACSRRRCVSHWAKQDAAPNPRAGSPPRGPRHRPPASRRVSSRTRSPAAPLVDHNHILVPGPRAQRRTTGIVHQYVRVWAPAVSSPRRESAARVGRQFHNRPVVAGRRGVRKSSRARSSGASTSQSSSSPAAGDRPRPGAGPAAAKRLVPSTRRTATAIGRCQGANNRSWPAASDQASAVRGRMDAAAALARPDCSGRRAPR